MNKQKGISTLLIILIIVGLAIIIGGGIFTYQYLTTQQPQTTVCTKEAKVCPDGSSIYRTGTNCEFAECPTTEDFSNLGPKDTYLVIKITRDKISNLDEFVSFTEKYGATKNITQLESATKGLSDSEKNQMFTAIESMLIQSTELDMSGIKEAINGNNATLTITAKDPTSKLIVTMVRENNIWKLASENFTTIIQPADQTTGWKTYNFTATSYLPKNFSFKYPSDWEVDLLGGDGVIITSPDLTDQISYYAGSPGKEITCDIINNMSKTGQLGKSQCVTIEGIPYYILYQRNESLNIYNQIRSTFKFTE